MKRGEKTAPELMDEYEASDDADEKLLWQVVQAVLTQCDWALARDRPQILRLRYGSAITRLNHYVAERVAELGKAKPRSTTATREEVIRAVRLEYEGLRAEYRRWHLRDGQPRPQRVATASEVHKRVARALNCSASKVYRWWDEGHISAVADAGSTASESRQTRHAFGDLRMVIEVEALAGRNEAALKALATPGTDLQKLRRAMRKRRAR